MKLSELSGSTQGLFYVFMGSVVISFGPLFMKWVDAGPAVVASYRMFWGSIPLLALALAKGHRIIPGKKIMSLLLLGATMYSMDVVSWHYSILYVGPGLATILSNFQVFFLAFYGSFILREKMGTRTKIAIPATMICLWFVLDVKISEITRDITLGFITGILSGFFYSFYVVSVRKSQMAADKLSPLANTGLLCFFATFICGFIGLINGENLIIHSVRDNLLMIVCGVVVQGMGWVLLSKGLPLLPTARVGVVMMTMPAFSFLWDVLFFGRPTSLLGYLGAAGALAAISLGALDKGKTAKSPHARCQKSL